MAGNFNEGLRAALQVAEVLAVPVAITVGLGACSGETATPTVPRASETPTIKKAVTPIPRTPSPTAENPLRKPTFELKNPLVINTDPRLLAGLARADIIRISQDIDSYLNQFGCPNQNTVNIIPWEDPLDPSAPSAGKPGYIGINLKTVDRIALNNAIPLARFRRDQMIRNLPLACQSENPNPAPFEIAINQQYKIVSGKGFSFDLVDVKGTKTLDEAMTISAIDVFAIFSDRENGEKFLIEGSEEASLAATLYALVPDMPTAQRLSIMFQRDDLAGFIGFMVNKTPSLLTSQDFMQVLSWYSEAIVTDPQKLDSLINRIKKVRQDNSRHSLDENRPPYLADLALRKSELILSTDPSLSPSEGLAAVVAETLSDINTSLDYIQRKAASLRSKIVGPKGSKAKKQLKFYIGMMTELKAAQKTLGQRQRVINAWVTMANWKKGGIEV